METANEVKKPTKIKRTQLKPGMHVMAVAHDRPSWSGTIVTVHEDRQSAELANPYLTWSSVPGDSADHMVYKQERDGVVLRTDNHYDLWQLPAGYFDDIELRPLPGGSVPLAQISVAHERFFFLW